MARSIRRLDSFTVTDNQCYRIVVYRRLQFSTTLGIPHYRSIQPEDLQAVCEALGMAVRQAAAVLQFSRTPPQLGAVVPRDICTYPI